MSTLDRVELPHFIDEVMVRWQVPGVAVAVVENGKVVYSGGFGTREVGSRERVSAQTVFAIGSTTKAFTATAIGVLVDQGLLDWDEPLRNVMPGFSLSSPFATLHATTRDPKAEPTLKLAEYAGKYSHPAYGDLSVRFDGEKLVGLFHGLKGHIEFYENDIFVFKVKGEIFQDTFQLSFHVVPGRGVVSVYSPLHKGVAPIEFVRVSGSGNNVTTY